VAPAAVPGRLATPGALDQPTARALRQADVLRAQGALGNRRVARLLAQRQDADPASVGAGGTPPATAPATGLIVDDAAEPSPNQLRKGDFLQQLRTTVAAAAGQALAGTPWADEAEPEIARQLAGYAALDPAALERTLRQQLPGGDGIQTAAALFPLAAERVQAAIRDQLPPAAGGGIESIVAGAAATATRAVSSVTQTVSSAIGAVGGGLAALGRALFKRRPGAATADVVPPIVRSELGAGEPLAGSVHTGIGQALGHDFSGVRVHTDGRAAATVSRLGARALAVGKDVAFAAGEYQPGTPIGDALIAHELAHVAQQAGSAQRMAAAEPETGALEAEADEAAAGAVVALHGGERAAGLLRQPVLPRLKTGLRLQLNGCGSGGRTAAAQSALLDSFRRDFPDSARLIDGSPAALRLLGEAERAGSRYGGFAEDGPAHNPWPYTVGDSVYIPRARRADAVLAMSDFLFEINNALRAPQFTRIHAAGQAGTITARQYARQKVEQEVDGMLRLGEVWFEMKRAHGGTDWDRYDGEFYLQEYQAVRAGRQTRDDVVNSVLGRVYPSGANAGKTVEQYYMEQYEAMHPRTP
jgi:hypothetical protein